jgi:hypothetical protein
MVGVVMGKQTSRQADKQTSKWASKHKQGRDVRYVDRGGCKEYGCMNAWVLGCI